MNWRRALAVTTLLVSVGACSAAPLDAPAPVGASPLPHGTGAEPLSPTGAVIVAYPEEPATWYPPLGGEPAAGDLAHLWGLPLYRIDPAGHLREGLVAAATTGDREDGWAVDLVLRPGQWSDGTPVTAVDVAATVDALKAAPETAAEFAVVVAVEVVADDVVRMRFAQPYARWPYLLAGGAGVLPAHVLAEAGLAAYRGLPTVTGGPFTIASYERGRRVVFEAHDGAAEGAPGLRRVEVAFVPDVETALGLMQRAEADVSIGYLALNPVERGTRVEGVAAAAPLGGTAVWLRWRTDGALGGAGGVDRRGRIRAAIDVEPQVEGLLGGFAEVARSVVPGQAGPWAADAPSPSLAGVSPSLLVPRWQEAVGFTARSLQRDVKTFGGDVELIRLEPDALVSSPLGDGRLEVRRDVPWPSLSAAARGEGPAVQEAASAADGALTRSGAAVAADAVFLASGHIQPLYRVGVLHAWRASVQGLEPSSWAGAGFWNAHRWQRSEG